MAEVRDSLGFVTLLVNNAGTADIELFTDMTDEKLCEMMNVNLLGAMRMSRAVLPEMIREHSGNVINITSVWGEKGASCEVAYSAAKAGLIGFTKALARKKLYVCRRGDYQLLVFQSDCFVVILQVFVWLRP